MKLYAICLIKDEDDIVAQTLTYAMQHCDKIFVIDNGSSDRTWEIVQELAVQHPKIVPFEQTHLPYNDALRARVYNRVHKDLGNNDWWMILDSDEFLAEDPKPLMQQALNQGADIIRSWQIQFYYTEKDLAEWEAGKDRRDRAIFERRQYYLINWQEPRLFRNQTERTWNAEVSSTVPDGLNKVFVRRILNRHYQFRDPEQMEKRLRLRFGHPSFRAHVLSTDWRSVIRDSRKLNCYMLGQPWRFSVLGVIYYYRKSLYYAVRGKCAGAFRRLQRLLVREGSGKDAH